MDKKADVKLMNREFIGIILAVAGIFLIALLFFKLIAPIWDQEEETAKSYLESFKDVMEEVEKNGYAEFSLWGGETKMVYFGDKVRLEANNKDIFFNHQNKDLCFCYEEDVFKCDYCTDLNKPAEFSDDKMVHEEGSYFEIRDEGDKYFFEVEIRK
ncbi:MAG: hypothetical protein ACP5D2_02175 [Candidatus Nanoarchaeia archaeon]